MSNARANAAVYDQRRRKLKKRNKRYFQRIMIALIAFYAICLTSKMWLKNNYKNIDSNFMKLISRYRSENPWYFAVFNPTETHTFQTRS